MEASHKLPHSSATLQISKHGVLTLYGFGIRVSMQAGHLDLEDGIGLERRRLRLPRVNHGLKRLVCISEDGFVTLSALRWLSEVGASFLMLDRLGKIRVVTGPVSSSEAKLRRSQALALGNGRAVPIAREIIAGKLRGQEILLRDKLNNDATAKAFAEFQRTLVVAKSIAEIRSVESHAAAAYWRAWREVPILFPRKDSERIPDHWLRFGTRSSPLTGGPRLSVNPANSLLNFTFAVAESECRLAAAACGLDPGIGLIHTDTANRDSLALDIIEPIRPAVEAWLLDWLMREPLRRSDFLETANGCCRLSSSLCSMLAETAPVWARMIAPWAEYVAHSLSWAHSQSKERPRFKTPLTQSHRRQAKGAPPQKTIVLKPQHSCRGCGTSIKSHREHCASCAVDVAAGRFVEVARIGRAAAHSPEARAKQRDSRRGHATAISSWDPSSQPAWLTRDFFSKEVRPALAKLSSSEIRSRLGVSRWYAGKIRKGYCPHERHWKILADLVTASRQ